MGNPAGQTSDCPYREMCSDNEVKCKTCIFNYKRSLYCPIKEYNPPDQTWNSSTTYDPLAPFFHYNPCCPSWTSSNSAEKLDADAAFLKSGRLKDSKSEAK